MPPMFPPCGGVSWRRRLECAAGREKGSFGLNPLGRAAHRLLHRAFVAVRLRCLRPCPRAPPFVSFQQAKG
eukprot:1288310-Pyramimonas_sp.AAC.1